MKVWIKYGLVAIFAAGFTAGTLLMRSAGAAKHAAIVCTGIDIRTVSGPELACAKDIEDFLAYNYGEFLGQKLSELDLASMERKLCANGMIVSCDAWTTDDGVLHLKVRQRIPAVRFAAKDGNGFYCDAEGFVFPLSSCCNPEVPVVRGRIQKALERDYLLDLVDFVCGTCGNRYWSGRIESFRILDNGELAFVLNGSGTVVRAGHFVDIDRKMRAAKTFIERIEPLHARGYYKTVFLDFKGQIICRKD